MTELFLKGGIMMYPLALCSIIAFTITLERLWNLRRGRVISPELVSVLARIEKPEDFGLAQSVCKANGSPFSQIISACIDNRDLPKEELRVTIEDEGRQQVRSLSRGLGALETIASISPLLGLLGTVIGMINVFNVIETLGVGQAKALSGGISEALITTATGLFIGVPVLIAYNYFSSRSESLTLDIERYTIDLLAKILRINRQEEAVDIRLRSE